MADHLERRSHILQDLGRVFAKLAELAPAIRTGIMAWQVRVGLARKMLWQGTAGWLPRRRLPGGSNRPLLLSRLRGLQFFQLQLQLLDLTKDLLALRSEEHPLELLNQ